MTDTDPRCAKCGHKRSEHNYRHPFIGPSRDDTINTLSDRIEGLEAKLAKLNEATDYTRNRLEIIASDAWNIDGRDLKRNLQGMFAEYDATLAEIKAEPKEKPHD